MAHFRVHPSGFPRAMPLNQGEFLRCLRTAASFADAALEKKEGFWRMPVVEAGTETSEIYASLVFHTDQPARLEKVLVFLRRNHMAHVDTVHCLAHILGRRHSRGEP